MRAALLAAAARVRPRRRATAGPTATSTGPRFNTPTEIAQLAGCGVVAVSQTGGPETVLCGELELPFALVGFVTDYANEVVPGEPTPVSTLIELMGTEHRRCSPTCSPWRSTGCPADAPAAPGGTMYRFEQG